MIRTTALLLGICSLAAGQSSELQRAFWREAASLSDPRANGGLVSVNTKVQEELRFSPDSVQVMLSTLREYNAGAEILERQLKRAVFERRMQAMAGEKVTIALESELVAATDLLVDALIARKMQELKERLGEQEFQNLTKFIEDGDPKKGFFPVRAEARR